MAEKYVTYSNLTDILNGIQTKIPGANTLITNSAANRRSIPLISSPVVVYDYSGSVSGWKKATLSQNITDYDELEIVYSCTIGGSSTSKRSTSFVIPKDEYSLLDNPSGITNRGVDSMVISLGIQSGRIESACRLLIKTELSVYNEIYFAADLGSTDAIAGAMVTIEAMNGINYVEMSNDTPIGTLIDHLGTNAPSGYLVCDGSTYNIVDEWELAEFIKDNFGVYNYFGGDGTTTFAVPKFPDSRETVLWTGDVSTTQATYNLSDSIENYDEIGFYNFVTMDGTNYIRPLFRTLRVPQVIDMLNGVYGNSDSSTTWGYSNNGDYVDIQKASTPTSLLIYQYRSRLQKIVGIKYTCASDYSCKCVKSSSAVAQLQEYSTTEKRIGTWIDGSPLYQKTYTATSPSAINTSGDVVTLASNIHIKSIDAIMDTTSGTLLLLNHYVSATDFASVWRTSVTGNLRMSVGSTSYTSQPVYITIRYTKS